MRWDWSKRSHTSRIRFCESAEEEEGDEEEEEGIDCVVLRILDSSSAVLAPTPDPDPCPDSDPGLSSGDECGDMKDLMAIVAAREWFANSPPWGRRDDDSRAWVSNSRA